MLAKVFEHSHRVGYSECTVGNHVYFSRYLDILEEARGEFFRHAGFPLLDLQRAGMVFPMVGVEISYKRPARYDDLVTVQLRVTQLSGVRLAFGFRILGGKGETMVEGELRQVCTDENERPRRIAPEVAERLEAFHETVSQASPLKAL
jgi:acyl-CoA thioester hydrolase